MLVFLALVGAIGALAIVKNDEASIALQDSKLHTPPAVIPIEYGPSTPYGPPPIGILEASPDRPGWFDYTDPARIFSLSFPSPPWQITEDIEEGGGGCNCIYFNKFPNWRGGIVIFHPFGTGPLQWLRSYREGATPVETTIHGEPILLFDDLITDESFSAVPSNGRVLFFPASCLLVRTIEQEQNSMESHRESINQILDTLSIHKSATCVGGGPRG